MLQAAFLNGDIGTCRCLYLTKPTFASARGNSRLSINHRQMFPVRAFSALSNMIPTLMPITSLSTQPVAGLKASTNPYRPYTLSPYLSRIARRAATDKSGVNIKDPPAADGTTVPSIATSRGGPPQASDPFALSEAVIPQMFGPYPGNSCERFMQKARCASVALIEFSK